jgi:hypothetical protein
VGNDDPPRLAGQSARDLRWAFEQTLGVEVVARALASLPDETRAAYADVPVLGWVDYRDVVAAHEAIAREAGTTMEAMLERAVPLAVERAFRTVWRILLRFSSDATLIARTPLLYSKTRSKGTMRSELLSAGRASCVLTGWPNVPPRDIRALSLSIATLLRLCGRNDVHVDGEPSEDGARFHVTWRV